MFETWASNFEYFALGPLGPEFFREKENGSKQEVQFDEKLPKVWKLW